MGRASKFPACDVKYNLDLSFLSNKAQPLRVSSKRNFIQYICTYLKIAQLLGKLYMHLFSDAVNTYTGKRFLGFDRWL